VILYRWDRQPEEGLINSSSYLSSDLLEWLTPDGRIQQSSLEQCKALCFFTEAGKPDLFVAHSTFDRRPKSAGLWTRLFFRDGSVLDGILSHNLLEWPTTGYLLLPPQARASRQRIFVPRSALIATELRGVIGVASGAAAKQAPRAEKSGDSQLSMFDS